MDLFFKGALVLFDDMKEQKLKLKVVTYTVLLKSDANLTLWKKIDQMKIRHILL